MSQYPIFTIDQNPQAKHEPLSQPKPKPKPRANRHFPHSQKYLASLKHQRNSNLLPALSIEAKIKKSSKKTDAALQKIKSRAKTQDKLTSVKSATSSVLTKSKLNIQIQHSKHNYQLIEGAEPLIYSIYGKSEQLSLMKENEQNVEKNLSSTNQSHQQMTKKLFIEATNLFHFKKYEKGLEKINICIKSCPNSVILRIDRALFYDQLGDIAKAIRQLQLCLQLDHLNYLAYFNLFSIKIKNKQIQEAFDELCCSLSCLYLKKAKLAQNEVDSNKAVQYCKNNVQAQILRCFLRRKNKKLVDESGQINEQERENFNKINEIVNNYLKQKQQTQNKQIIWSDIKRDRLRSSYVRKSDLEIEMQQKMAQFNQIFKSLFEQDIKLNKSKISLNIMDFQQQISSQNGNCIWVLRK